MDNIPHNPGNTKAVILVALITAIQSINEFGRIGLDYIPIISSLFNQFS